MNLGLAYKTWTRFFPELDEEECDCPIGHQRETRSGNLIPIPDEECCPRERAWRYVVRIRDKNPTWPFKKEQFN